MSAREKTFLAAIVTGIVCGFLAWAVCYYAPEPAPEPETAPVIVETNTTAPTTTTTITRPTAEPHHPLTDKERDLVERVVMAEAGGEAYVGQLAIAQCILNASQLRGMSPAQVVIDLKYSKARPEPTEQVKEAVAAVFDDGVQIFDPEVIYFYAPALVDSAWHESQDYVTTIGCHRFFKEAR